MRIGICTTDFDRAMPADELFAKVAAMGFECVQLAFSSVSECGYDVSAHIEIPENVSQDAIAAIRAASDKHSLPIVAVNGTFNMAHPDIEVRREGLRRFAGFLDAVKALGCGMATLCSGSRSLKGLWTYDTATAQPDAWEDMSAVMLEAVKMAEARGIVLAIETEASNVISTPEAARRIMDDIGSPNLKMILDCANLFHAGKAHPQNVRTEIDRAIEHFGHDIVIAHGKDILESNGIDFCATGAGIVDFPYMIKRLRDFDFEGDLLLHGIYAEESMPGCLDFIRKCL